MPSWMIKWELLSTALKKIWTQKITYFTFLFKIHQSSLNYCRGGVLADNTEFKRFCQKRFELSVEIIFLGIPKAKSSYTHILHKGQRHFISICKRKRNFFKNTLCLPSRCNYSAAICVILTFLLEQVVRILPGFTTFFTKKKVIIFFA